jgi:hypothetical protein
MQRFIYKNEVISSLKRHQKVTPEYIRKIQRIPKQVLENVGTDLAKEAVALSREVDSDLHAHKAFLRLSISPHGIIYARLDKMKHRNEKPLLEFYSERFPIFMVLFSSKRGVFAAKNGITLISEKGTLEETLKKLESDLPLDPLLTELKNQNHEELWKKFAKSQLIKGAQTSSQMKLLAQTWKNTVAKNDSKNHSLEKYLR